MKAIFISLALVLGFSSVVLSQEHYYRTPPRHINHRPPIYIRISGTYRIKRKDTISICGIPTEFQRTGKSNPDQTNYRTRNFHLTVTITNTNPSLAYQDIKYETQFYSGDGVYEGMKIYDVKQIVAANSTLILKNQRLKCPRDCKTINVVLTSYGNIADIQKQQVKQVSNSTP